jgi:hypothetical protein
MLVIIAIMVSKRAGPLRVTWSTSFWMRDMGGSDVSESWSMTLVVVMVAVVDMSIVWEGS